MRTLPTSARLRECRLETCNLVTSGYSCQYEQRLYTRSLNQRTTQTVLVLTELAGNTGRSVTNCIEDLTTLAVNHHNLYPAELLVLEHYGPDYYHKYAKPQRQANRLWMVDNIDETLEVVSFTWYFTQMGITAKHPKWRRIWSQHARDPQSTDPLHKLGEWLMGYSELETAP